MQPFYDAIYLSPHLDDVTLSCGGQVYQATNAGQRVLIVTITAGDPPQTAVSGYAQSLHDRWELVTDAVAARRAEDKAANAILGADTLHWSLPDCIYRYHPTTGASLYVSDPDIFGEVNPAELPLAASLRDQIVALPAHRQLYVPLTIGHHVDHQLTRLAAEQAFPKAMLCYYECPKTGGTSDSHSGWRSDLASDYCSGNRSSHSGQNCCHCRLQITVQHLFPRSR